MKRRQILIAAMLLLPLSITAQVQNKKAQIEVGRAQEIFTSTLSGAVSYYVDTFDVQKVSNVAINAMLSQLDPYTEYIPEMNTEDFSMMTTGEYAGIGAYIQLVDSVVYVQYPMPNSPASKAGLGMGDAFLEINGESVIPGTPSLVSGKLRGPVGTSVKVKVRKLGETDPVEVVLTRQNVVVDQVVHHGMYQDSIGYIRLNSFTTKSASDVRRAYQNLNSGDRMKSLILDLRSNAGGVMDGAIELLSMFVPKGTKVLYTKGRLPQTSQEYFTESEPLSLDLPLVVLINGGSASASEIVAGALQDLDRAVIMGTKSFGKGLVQSTLPTPYDGILKVTISRYYIPSGRCIQQLDYSHRRPDGTVDAVPDSLTQVFHTLNGREVRDGGGIRPDIEIKGETLDAVVYAMSSQGRLFEYVNELYLNRPHPQQLSDVEITDEEMDRLVDFLEEKGLEYGQLSSTALKEVQKLGEFEGYDSEETKKAFEALEQLLTPSLRRDMEKSRDQAKRMLRGLLAQHYFGQEGQYAVTLEKDPTMNGALELLGNKARYNQILGKTIESEQ